MFPWPRLKNKWKLNYGKSIVYGNYNEKGCPFKVIYSPYLRGQFLENDPL
jgi:hypothetical protein